MSGPGPETSRGRSARRVRSAGTALLVGAFSTRAAAEPPLTSRYHVVAGCPDEASFQAQVAGRTDRRASARRAFEVEVETSPDGFVGRLVGHDARGGVVGETVVGAVCSEVVAGLALLTALALDPEASTAPRAAPATPAAVSAGPTPDAAPPPPDARWGGAVGVEGLALGAASPRLAFGGGLFGEVTVDRPSAVSPTLRLSGAFATATDDVERGGSARYDLWAGRLDACPLRLGLAKGLSARPCLALEVGALRVGAKGLAVNEEHTARWVDVAALGRLRGIWLHPFFFELEAGLLAPLTRPTFAVDAPPTTVHHVPPFGGAFGAAMGMHFL